LNAQSYSTGSYLGSTSFQASTPAVTSIPSGGTKSVQFRFEVPGTVRSYAYICPIIYVAENPGPIGTTNDKNVGYFNTLGQAYASCIYKSPAGFRVLTEEESPSVLRELASPTLVVDPPKKP
jgi:hypothetical protein